MRKILIVVAVVVSLAVLAGCAHPKDYPEKIKEGFKGKKTPEAKAENDSYKKALDEMQIVHEREQKAGAVRP